MAQSDPFLTPGEGERPHLKLTISPTHAPSTSSPQFLSQSPTLSLNGLPFPHIHLSFLLLWLITAPFTIHQSRTMSIFPISTLFTLLHPLHLLLHLLLHLHLLLQQPPLLHHRQQRYHLHPKVKAAKTTKDPQLDVFLANCIIKLP